MKLALPTLTLGILLAIAACAVGRITARASNMKAMVSRTTSGFDRSAELALSNVAASGPWPVMQLCRLAPPGTKPSALAS